MWFSKSKMFNLALSQLACPIQQKTQHSGGWIMLHIYSIIKMLENMVWPESYGPKKNNKGLIPDPWYSECNHKRDWTSTCSITGKLLGTNTPNRLMKYILRAACVCHINRTLYLYSEYGNWLVTHFPSTLPLPLCFSPPLFSISYNHRWSILSCIKNTATFLLGPFEMQAYWAWN